MARVEYYPTDQIEDDDFFDGVPLPDIASVTYKDYLECTSETECILLMERQIRARGEEYLSPSTTPSKKSLFSIFFGISHTRLNELAAQNEWNLRAAQLRNQAEILAGLRRPIPDSKASLEETIAYLKSCVQIKGIQYTRPYLLSPEFEDIFGMSWGRLEVRKQTAGWGITVGQMISLAEGK